MLIMGKIIVVYSKPYNSEQETSLKVAEKSLQSKKADYILCDRKSLNSSDFLDAEIVIAVGGDGTFLRASHFIKGKILIFGMNSDHANKEGFYMGSNRYDFDGKLERILERKFRIKKLIRLEASINKKRVSEPALNEYYFGSAKPYLTSRYSIEIGGEKERQRSSGVLIATPTGSEAWLKASGVKVRQLSGNIAYSVREPYERKILSNYKLRGGILGQNAEIKIKPEMEGGILVADSLSREYPLKYGDALTVKISDSFLSVIDFSA